MTTTEPEIQPALIGLVIDRSGSMTSIRQSTIDGVNEFLASHRETGVETLISMILFSNQPNVRHVAIDVNEIPEFGSADSRYNPDGGTALYDSVATMITGLQNWHDHHIAWDGKTIVVIMTDGQENSSRGTTLLELNRMMEAQKEKGWDFVFLGAGEDAWTQGSQFTALTQSVAYAGGSQSANSQGYAAAAASTTSIRSGIAVASNIDIP